MSTLPYLDTEEKLRDYTKQHWNIDIEPALISAHCEDSDRVLIFPSAAYKLSHSMVCYSSVGVITYKQESLVHPCVLPVLEEAYYKKEQEKHEENRKRMQAYAEHLRTIHLLKAENQARVREQYIRNLSQEIEEKKKAPSTKQVRADIHQRSLAAFQEAMNEPYHEKKQCEAAPPKGGLARLLQKWKQS